MRKFYFLFLVALFILSSLACFAQEGKPTVNRIGTWRADMSCRGMELGQVIRTYKNDAVAILQNCCKKHSSACLDSYSSPDNKTLLYIAVEEHAPSVVSFLLNLSPNYILHINAYGKTIDHRKETRSLTFIETVEDPTSKTPLMLACYNNDFKTTEILLLYGASLLKKNFTADGKLNKNAYEYAQISPNKNATFLAYIEKEYKKQKNLFDQN